MNQSLDRWTKYFSSPKVVEVFQSSFSSISILKGGQHFRIEPDQKPMPQVKQIRAVQEFIFMQGLRLDPKHPSAGGIIREKQIRWHILIPPAAPNGPIISLRRHSFSGISLHSFTLPKTCPADWLEQVTHTLRVHKRPILICGETGSGKTSLLVSLLRSIAVDKRVLFLEQIQEIPMIGSSWVSLLTHGPSVSCQESVTTKDLFLDCLRLRPDWLVFGELRATDLGSFVDALDSGHKGVVATVHVASPDELKRRISAAGFNPVTVESTEILWLFLDRDSPPRLRLGPNR